MAKAAPEGLITALDIGSSKVSAMIAQKGDGGELIVLGTGQRESKGVKRGYIAEDYFVSQILKKQSLFFYTGFLLSFFETKLLDQTYLVLFLFFWIFLKLLSSSLQMISYNPPC